MLRVRLPLVLFRRLLFLAGAALPSLALLLAPLPASAAYPTVPADFHVSVRAQGLANPTAMSIGPDGRLYVAEQGGTVLALLGGGQRRVVASGYATILGLTWYQHRLYVSSTGEVSVLTPNRSYTSFTARVIISGLPTGKHQNDGMAFHGGWMYLGVGSTCNACAESDRRSATIMRFRPDGSRGSVYARGLRNPYGLAIQPRTGALYATDNGRDDFDDEVPDELNHIVAGGKYGWPDCWGNGGGSNCRGTIGPVALLEPHSSADGLAFYTERTFPAHYRGDAFIAEFGQTVCCGDNGHKVKDVHFSGKHTTVSDFATGLDNPLAVVVARNGSLLVADYGTGVIWSIQANGH